MTVKSFRITGKVRTNPLDPVGMADFRCVRDGEVDPGLLLESSSISPYALDLENRQAVFVETPASVDLARAPFYYQAQYEAAERLFAAPIETVCRLARAVSFDPAGLILIYSTGRCGSTLVSHAFNQLDDAVGFSEPDVFMQLQIARAVSGETPEVVELARALPMLLCGAAAKHRDARLCALKLRSYGIEMGELFFQLFPRAKAVFLYRDAESWARSAALAFRAYDPALIARYPEMLAGLKALVPRLAETKAESITPTELLASMWISVIERYLALHRLGIPMFAARYQDLERTPRAVLDAMFAHCSTTARPPRGIEDVLAADAQAGTTLARDRARENVYPMTEEALEELRHIVARAGLAPDSIVPGTFLPEPAP